MGVANIGYGGDAGCAGDVSSDHGFGFVCRQAAGEVEAEATVFPPLAAEKGEAGADGFGGGLAAGQEVGAGKARGEVAGVGFCAG